MPIRYDGAEGLSSQGRVGDDGIAPFSVCVTPANYRDD